MNIAFGQSVASFDPAALAHIESVREMVVIHKFIIGQADVGRTSFRLDVVEPAKIMVAIDFFYFHAFLPVSEYPARSMPAQITAKADAQQIKFSVGNNRRVPPIPTVLGWIIIRRCLFQAIRVIRPTITLSLDPLV